MFEYGEHQQNGGKGHKSHKTCKAVASYIPGQGVVFFGIQDPVASRRDANGNESQPDCNFTEIVHSP
jgi:hypothetical protein